MGKWPHERKKWLDWWSLKSPQDDLRDNQIGGSLFSIGLEAYMIWHQWEESRGISVLYRARPRKLRNYRERLKETPTRQKKTRKKGKEIDWQCRNAPGNWKVFSWIKMSLISWPFSVVHLKRFEFKREGVRGIERVHASVWKTEKCTWLSANVNPITQRNDPIRRVNGPPICDLKSVGFVPRCVPRSGLKAISSFEAERYF